MKFGIDCGHGGNDPGAIGCGFQERELTRQLGKLVTAKLKNQGHFVVDCSPNWVGKNLSKRCAIANNNRVDYFVSLHFNAFNSKAHGTEILYVSDRGLALAQKVLPEIVALGFKNRGCKIPKRRLTVLYDTDPPAILIEPCFIDCLGDMRLYNPEKMATAIVKGLNK